MTNDCLNMTMSMTFPQTDLLTYDTDAPCITPQSDVYDRAVVWLAGSKLGSEVLYNKLGLHSGIAPLVPIYSGYKMMGWRG